LSASHNNIGNIYRSLRDYDQALKHLNLLYQIKLKALPSRHPDIGRALKNIGLVYEDKGKFQRALDYVKEAAKIFHHSLHSTHPDVVQIEKDIKRISSNLK
jgi:tetratricopeptide (TPR) repeat protein